MVHLLDISLSKYIPIYVIFLDNLMSLFLNNISF
jgi:hypothetical protein